MTEEQQIKLEAAVKRSAEMVFFDQIERPVQVRSADAWVTVGMSRCKPGDWVRVRIASENVTRLGIMLGNLPTGRQWAMYHPGEQCLQITLDSNPCMYVPELGRTVWGRESWWSPIKTPDDLAVISDADISNVWYVQALKSLHADPAPTEAP